MHAADLESMLFLERTDYAQILGSLIGILKRAGMEETLSRLRQEVQASAQANPRDRHLAELLEMLRGG